MEGPGTGVVGDEKERARFEELVLPHLDSAYNLARWLVRSADAEDLTHEAMLRAMRYFGGFRGGNPRAWLMRIVRNTCYTWLEGSSGFQGHAEFDEEVHGTREKSPESVAIEGSDRQRLFSAIEALAPRLREVLVLRELEGCSYKEIAEIAGIPIGTVMSSLARARERLRKTLQEEPGRGDP